MVVFVIKCTNTWLGILCSNTPFPHNVFDIGFISRFPALLAFDLEDIGVIFPEILISIRISRVVYCDFIRALVAIALICIQDATKLFV
jgi:hypothetical protein